MVTRHQYGISALVTQTSFCEGSSDDLAKRRLFFQATACAVTREIQGAYFARLFNIKMFQSKVEDFTFECQFDFNFLQIVNVKNAGRNKAESLNAKTIYIFYWHLFNRGQISEHSFYNLCHAFLRQFLVHLCLRKRAIPRIISRIYYQVHGYNQHRLHSF